MGPLTYLLGLEDAVHGPDTPGKERDEEQAGDKALEPLVGGSLVHHHDCGCGFGGEVGANSRRLRVCRIGLIVRE